jgi:hypothetical protein
MKAEINLKKRQNKGFVLFIIMLQVFRYNFRCLYENRISEDMGYKPVPFWMAQTNLVLEGMPSAPGNL